jgi:predicted ester cyclase
VKGQIFNIAHSGKRMKGRTGSFTRLSDNRITN